jgi:hypothetical protein
VALFSKHQRRSLDDPDFGHIEEAKSGRWKGDEFQLWGFSSIQVMIDGGQEGPSPQQRDFVHSLRSDHEGIRSRIEQSLVRHAKGTSRQTGPFALSSIYIPKAPPAQMWRVWYDLQGEEHYSYGAEIRGWHRVVPFTED